VNASWAGRLSAAWHTNGHSGAQLGQTAYDSARHVLYYSSFPSQDSSAAEQLPSTVRAVNVVTGAVLWQASVPGQLDGLFLYENRLVLAPVAKGVDSGNVTNFWIIDTATGDIAETVFGLNDTGKVAGVSDGNVITEGPDPHAPVGTFGAPTFTAYSLKTGLETWHAAGACMSDPVADDDVIVALCGSAVAGLNPANGRPEWSYQLRGAGLGSASLYLHDGIIEVQDTATAQEVFLNEQGGKILSTAVGTQSSGQTPVYFGTVGSLLQFVDENAANRPEVVSADIATGKVEQRVMLPGGFFLGGNNSGTNYFPAGVDFAVGAAYFVASLPAPFTGQALVEVNTRDGSQTVDLGYPQLASDRVLASGADVTNAITVPVSGSALLVGPTGSSSDGLVAYHASPPSTGGTLGVAGTARHWPSACSLLAPAGKQLLTRDLGTHYNAVPVIQTAVPALPNASTCTYVPKAATTANLIVTVAGDATSAAAAKAALAAGFGQAASGGAAKLVRGPWDLGYLLENEGGPDSPEGFVMVVGTLTVKVTSTVPGASQAFAQALAPWLRGQAH
jgi:hypothetical protein